MTAGIKFRVREVDVFSSPHINMRFPFQFGAAVISGCASVYLRVTLESDQGKHAAGVSSCGLSSFWFDKEGALESGEDPGLLLRTVRVASEAYLSAGSGSAWELHQQVNPAVRKTLGDEGLNDLTAGYGIALMDAAIVDAICRMAGTTFHQALRGNLLGLDPELTRILPETPARSIHLRHTVGLMDPIRCSDLQDPLHDGLPEALEEIIREYGVSYFKIKVSRDIDSMRERLIRIAEILESEVRDYYVTFDGNEDFQEMQAFQEFIRQIHSEPRLSRFWERILFIEQPLARNLALEDSVSDSLHAIKELKPVIIDESDGTDDALDQALQLGYSGTSVKYCKGVLKTLNNYFKRAQWEKDGRGEIILSAEDLTHVPVVGLHQDLCTAAALGLKHCERNGQHYYRGLDVLDPAEWDGVLSNYPSLYRKRSQDLVTLEVRQGRLSLDEINLHGFGVIKEPDWNLLEQVGLPGRKD